MKLEEKNIIHDIIEKTADQWDEKTLEKMESWFIQTINSHTEIIKILNIFLSLLHEGNNQIPENIIFPIWMPIAFKDKILNAFRRNDSEKLKDIRNTVKETIQTHQETISKIESHLMKILQAKQEMVA